MQTDTDLQKQQAGNGPHASEPLNAVNLAVLNDPMAPLVSRIELLLKIVGRPMHYDEIADCLGQPLPLVIHTLVTHS